MQRRVFPLPALTLLFDGLVVAIAVGLPLPAHAADTLPDAATIRARVREAEHRPTSYRETVVFASSDGTTTIEKRFVRGADERVIEDDGVFHAEHGAAAGVDWRQNSNGQTVTDRPDPGRAVREKTTTTVTLTSAPVAALVVTTANGSGWGRRDVIDRATWQIVEHDRITAAGTIATHYDDVRDDRGRVFAHHWHIEDGVTQTKTEATVTEYEPGTVSAADVARPPSRRTLVIFPDGASSAVLPAQFDRHIFVRVKIGERGLDFVLDTGASGIAVDAQTARELGLRIHGEHSRVVAGRVSSGRAIVPEMKIGALTMRDVAVGIVPLGWKERPDVRVTGLLGYDFIAQLGMTIDYEHQRVTVVPGPAYTPPSEANTAALEARLGNGVPLVSASLDGTLAERLGIDTGGMGAFLLFDYFLRRNPEALRVPDGFDFAGDPHFSGVGGGFPARPAFVGYFDLGGFRLRNLMGFRVTSGRSFPIEADGVIGERVLRYFTLGLDYSNERIYLTPNTDGRTALGL